ncbi:MAG: hypothetical protein FWE64_02410 [Alphaproteobacteria bacterium]|nr:hypothetical protein [Alphaproteobacteria bacterium]
MKKLLLILPIILMGCSKLYTGAEVRDKLNSSVENMIDWDCLGEWESRTLDYENTISDRRFHEANFNSYRLTKAESEKHGILLMHGKPYDRVRVEAVLSASEAIITLGPSSMTLYYLNAKAVKNAKPMPTFYDGQWIAIDSNVCVALDGNKTHSYQTAVGKRTVQNVTLIPRYMKNQYYKPIEETADKSE